MMQDYVRTSTYQKAILANTDDFKDKVSVERPSTESKLDKKLYGYFSLNRAPVLCVYQYNVCIGNTAARLTEKCQIVFKI